MVHTTCYRILSIAACCTGTSCRDISRDDFVAAWPDAMLAQGTLRVGQKEGTQSSIALRFMCCD
eukprot:2237068-Alexandrium_andersonii.AAC.1